MFKSGSLATKIAHSSALSSLGSKDLRALQDLINCDKALITSIHRLAGDFSRSSEALKVWGQGEGDDLSDVLTHSATALNHIATAFLVFAAHQQSAREHMKSIRAREEVLDATRVRRKKIGRDAEAVEKKLSKMGPENKNLSSQTDSLNRLREEMRHLDSEIMTEEAQLSDYKRQISKTFMTLKLGGLLELAEKATIVSELGKRTIEEIPLIATTPGQSRQLYKGHQKTQKLDEEMAKCIAEVVFSSARQLPPPDTNIGNLSGDGDIYTQQAMSPIQSDLPYTLPLPQMPSMVGPNRRRSSIFDEINQFPAPPRLSDDAHRGGMSSDFSPPMNEANAGRASTFPKRHSRSSSLGFVPTPEMLQGTLGDDPADAQRNVVVVTRVPMPRPEPHPVESGPQMMRPPSEGIGPDGMTHGRRRSGDPLGESRGGPARPLPSRHPGGVDEGSRILFDPYAEAAQQRVAEPVQMDEPSQDGNLAAANNIRLELENFHFEPHSPSVIALTPPSAFTAARRSATPTQPPPALPAMQIAYTPLTDSFGASVAQLSSQQQQQPLPGGYYSPQPSPTPGADFAGHPVTTRTISAGAFKRSGENSPTTSSPPRKLPPSSLGPQRMGTLGQGSLYDPPGNAAPNGGSGGPAMQRLRREDDVGSMNGSMHYEELPRYQSEAGHESIGESAGGRGYPTYESGSLRGRGASRGGYGSGNFSTRLDS